MMMNEFMKNLESTVRDLELDLVQVSKINSKDFRSMKAYALSGHALTIRQVIRPLKGDDINKLYERLEAITEKATKLI